MDVEGATDLIAAAEQAADRIGALERPLRCVAHYDCDGISSAVILQAALERADQPVAITFVEELDAERLDRLAAETDEETVLFVDIGSGQIAEIQDALGDREVLIADHHEPGEGTVAYHVNPHLVGIDGGEQVSGAGVTYLLMQALDPANRDLVKYALVGATGDIQLEDDTYLGLNATFMEQALDAGVIAHKTGLKLFGRTGKSLVKALKYTTDPYLPGITNDESGAVQFLSETGIQLREDGDWRSLGDLSREEEKEIVHHLITKGYDVADLLGDIYILDNGWEIGEFSSLINACGRLGEPESGLKICLEDDHELAYDVKRRYGRKIGQYLSWVEDHLDDEAVLERMGSGAVLNAGDNIHYTMIGTIATIAQKSDIIDADVLVAMAHKGSDHWKLSARATQQAREDGFAMAELMDELCTVCEGQGGGHEAAAGGKIPRGEENRFIKMMREVLEAERVSVVTDG